MIEGYTMSALLHKSLSLSSRQLLIYNIVIMAIVTVGGFYLQWHTLTPYSIDFLAIVFDPGQYMIKGQPVPVSYPYPLWTPAIFLPFNYLPPERAIEYWFFINLMLGIAFTLAVIYLFDWQR